MTNSWVTTSERLYELDGGQVLHEAEFNGMVIRVVENFYSIRLEFGDRVTQSILFKKNHKRLERYCDEMVKVLEHVKDPKDILVLGMGGGRIPAYLLDTLPEVRVDVVDLVPFMAELAHKYFELPRSDRLNFIVGDALEYVAETDKQYDVIFVDLFNDEGVPGEFHGRYFYSNLLRINRGYIMFNSWVREGDYKAYMEGLREAFEMVHEQYAPPLGRLGLTHIAFCK